MLSSFKDEDVTLLLKDISGLIKPVTREQAEQKIQGGTHYCETLTEEYVPTETYLRMFNEFLNYHIQPVANAVSVLSAKLIQQYFGKGLVLVSLARAGTPVGVIIKRYIKYKYKIDVPHYSISIVRGRGIDKNAVNYLLKQYKPEAIVFVDGWVGKGAIAGELKKALEEYPNINPEVAVLADPAYITSLCGTRDDILIPNACLNSTISGLISRTVLRNDIIKTDDFHGVVWFPELIDSDLTYKFIESVEAKFIKEVRETADEEQDNVGVEEVKQIKEQYGVTDINFIKPGINETLRVLLRRVPWKILLNEDVDIPAFMLIKQLASEKGVEVEYRRMKHYNACGIIQNLADV